MFRSHWRRLCRLGSLATALVLALCGCWDRRETSEIAIVGSLGLDEGTEEGKVLVSFEVINADALARGIGQPGAVSQVAGWVLREQATTIFNALRNVDRRIPRRLFAGQVNTIIIGQSLARKGIAEYLDFFARQGQFRRTIFISVCDTGSGFLQRPFMEEVPSRTLGGLAATAVASGKSVEVNLNEFLWKLSEPGIEPIAMHTAGRETEDVAVKRQGEEVKQTRPAVNLRQPLESERNVPGILSPDSPVLDPFREAGTGEDVAGMSLLLGIAVFRGDRLVGALDGNDARGYLWAVGRAKEGLIEIPNPVGESGAIALEVIRTYSSITPVVRNGQVTMKVEITTDFELAEAQWPITTGDPTVVRRLIQAAAGLVEREVRSTLQIVQKQFRSDIYGFGQALYRRHPEVWRRVAGNWNEQVFPYLEVEVRVRSRIRSSGLVSREPLP